MRTGVIRLFRFAGIDVYLHFTWFLVAAIFMTDYMRRYQSPIWGVLEYISLFVIVLIHEFGHALACRQVGGVANRIVLWPLGGVAFVKPPLVWLAAGQSDDRCIKNGNSNFSFADCARKSGAAVGGHSLRDEDWICSIKRLRKSAWNRISSEAISTGFRLGSERFFCANAFNSSIRARSAKKVRRLGR